MFGRRCVGACILYVRCVGHDVGGCGVTLARCANSVSKMCKYLSCLVQIRAILKVKSDGVVGALLSEGRDALVKQLDTELGATIDDKSVFDKLARKFEKYYMEDMARLGIKEPDVLTRVTEYVPQIIEFIKKIEEKGLAYESQGSVYLDTVAFQKSGHHYRKLNPFKGETSANEMVRPHCIFFLSWVLWMGCVCALHYVGFQWACTIEQPQPLGT